MLGITSRSDLPVLFLGLFLGWLSLSWGAPIRVEEVTRGVDSGAAISSSNPPEELTQPWNVSKVVTHPPSSTADVADGSSIGMLNGDVETNSDGDIANTTVARLTTLEPASANSSASAAAGADASESGPTSDDETAPASSEDFAPAADDAAPTSSEGNGSKGDKNVTRSDLCAKKTCTPVIDVNASVIESYKRHRAQAALIGDFGSCISGPGTGRKPDGNSTRYTWTVDWGDDESYELKKDKIGPYQAEHVYAKKGKYTVAATFCHRVDGCDSSCTSFSKTIKVKP